MNRVFLAAVLTSFLGGWVFAASATFQNGVNNYSGTKDVSITTQYAADWNGYNGITYPSGDLLCYQTTGSSPYEARVLIRFDNLNVPSNSTVTSASLTLTFIDWQAGFTISGWYLALPWDANAIEGAYPDQLGWAKRNAVDTWSVPGVGGADVISGKSVPTIDGFNASGYQKKTVILDASVVQQWIDNPASNLGIILFNQTAGPMPHILSSENSTIPDRPILTVDYTSAGPTPPAPPGNLSATAISSTRIDLKWTDNSTDETAFLIERKTVGGVYAQIASVGPNITTFSNTGLSANTTYYYRVRATNTIGNSDYSNEASAVTPGKVTKPAAPSNLAAIPLSSSQIDLSWKDNSNNETSFKIERKISGGVYSQIANLGANVTAFSDTGLSANTTYYYRVRASNSAGNSSYSNIASATTLAPEPVASGHPRLLFTADDLPRLRSWTTSTNPLYEQGLKLLGENAKTAMDTGKLDQDAGGAYGWDPYPNEMYAELFAFLSLVENDETVRQDYAQRARSRLMYVMNQAVLGVSEGQPFRGSTFSTSNRSRWWGEGFPLTVDWIYPYLSATDKDTIRKVFLRWCDENMHAEITTDNHPEPIGVLNDPILLQDPIRLRWAGNNYFTAHMRNIGLMALAFDELDDPGNTLRDYLSNATGAWLYMVDALMSGDIKGGLPPEGFEYSPQAMGYICQFLLALHTAGEDDSSKWGPQVVLTNNSWWKDAMPAFLNSINPGDGQVSNDPNYSWMGRLYQPASYGDLANYWVPDFIGIFGPLALYDFVTGNTLELEALRWIQKNTPPGGAENINYRVGNTDNFFGAILYFLVFDPAAAVPTDPRPTEPLNHFAPGLGRILSRTDWSPSANWFTYKNGWSSIDHQQSDGNMFEFWRNGEWLTKERSGYGFNVGSTDYKNSIALENDAPYHNSPGDYRNINWLRGSQWLFVNDGSGSIPSHSFGPGYVYALGVSTDLYNSTYEGSTDVLESSRSIIWIQPDYIVVYDRAETKTAGRFKRFWLNLPFNGVMNGRQMMMTTNSGQKLYVDTLLPSDADVTLEPAEALDGEPAHLDPIVYRLKVEATGSPAKVRFLHALQGVDSGNSAAPVSLIQSSAGTSYTGSVIGNVAALFPVDLSTPFTSVTFQVPTTVTKYYVTGLTPNGYYTKSSTNVGNMIEVTIVPTGTMRADEGGVLMW